MLASPLLWIFPWAQLELVELKGIWNDIKSTIWISIIVLIFYLISYWCDTMFGFFIVDLFQDQKKVGIILGVNVIGQFFGISFGQFLFRKLTYHPSIIITFLVDAFASFYFLFLRSSTSYAAVIVLMLFAGLTRCVTRSLVQNLTIDASGLSSTSTFLYSLFQSIFNVGMAGAGIIYPQISKHLNWSWWWTLEMIFGISFAIIFSLIFYFVPSARKDRVLLSRPSLDLTQVDT